MSKMIMVTGGARSGKSSYAEAIAKSIGKNIIYIATAKRTDDEMILRIKKHIEQRPANWLTIEAYRGFDTILPKYTNGFDAALLDCITIMTTNLMLDCPEVYDCNLTQWDDLTMEQVQEVENNIHKEVQALINFAKSSELPFVFVTNEVGLGLVPEYKMGRDFRDIAGRVNQTLARACDEVYFCVSGIPMKIK